MRPHTAQISHAVFSHIYALSSKDPQLSDIDADFIHQLARYLAERVSPSSAATYLQRLHALLTFAIDNRLLDTDPMPPISKLLHRQKRQSKRTPLSREQLARLAQAPIPHESTRRAFYFSIYTGLRLSDIETLRWTDLAIRDGGVFLTKTQVKTGTPVSMLLTRRALDIIGRPSGNVQGLIFADLMSRGTIAADLSAWGRAARIGTKLTFHVARHTFASLLHSIGTSVADVSQLCGHSSVLTTERYIHGYDDKQRSAMIQMDRLLASAIPARTPKKVVIETEDMKLDHFFKKIRFIIILRRYRRAWKGLGA